MSKKIYKKASAIRTISLAVGSLSLLFIAFSQVTEKEVCTSIGSFNEKQITIS